jgi:hypothetical protein
MPCAVAGCIRPKAHSAPLCGEHWSRISLGRRMHWRRSIRHLDRALSTPGIDDEDRERMQALRAAVLTDILAELGEEIAHAA